MNSFPNFLNTIIIYFLLFRINSIKQDCFEYSCEECNSTEYGTCTKCRDDFTLIDGTCPCSDSSCALCTTGLAGLYICEQCKEGYINDNNNCKCSINNCDQCSIDGCKKCQTGYYYNETLKECIKDENKIKCFDPGCDTCISEEDGACERCKEGYELKKGECLNLTKTVNRRCPFGYIPSGNYCYEICRGFTCNILIDITKDFSLVFQCQENKCLACINGAIRIISECDNSDECSVMEGCLNCLRNDECLICQQGYYTNKGKCKKCSEGCSICSSENNCQVCMSGYELTLNNTCNLTYNFDYNTTIYESKKIELIKIYHPEEIPKIETSIPKIDSTISIDENSIKNINSISYPDTYTDKEISNITTNNIINLNANTDIKTSEITYINSINYTNKETSEINNIPNLSTTDIKIKEITYINSITYTNKATSQTNDIANLNTTDIQMNETNEITNIKEEAKTDLIISNKTEIISNNSLNSILCDEKCVKFYDNLDQYIISFNQNGIFKKEKCDSICSNINCLKCEIKDGSEICDKCPLEYEINSEKCESLCSEEKCSSYSVKENNISCNKCKTGYYLEGNICKIKCSVDNCDICSEDGKECTQCNSDTKLYQGKCAKNKKLCTNFQNCDYCFQDEGCIECEKGYELTSNNICIQKKVNFWYLFILILFAGLIISGIIYCIYSKIKKTENMRIIRFMNVNDTNNDNQVNNMQIHNVRNEFDLSNSIRHILSRDELAEEYEEQRKKYTKAKAVCMFCHKKYGNYKCDCGCIVCKEHSNLKLIEKDGQRYKVCFCCGKRVNNITAIKYFCNICMQNKTSVTHFKCGCALEVCKSCYIKCKLSNDKCPGCRAII